MQMKVFAKQSLEIMSFSPKDFTSKGLSNKVCNFKSKLSGLKLEEKVLEFELNVNQNQSISSLPIFLEQDEEDDNENSSQGVSVSYSPDRVNFGHKSSLCEIENQNENDLSFDNGMIKRNKTSHLLHKIATINNI